MHADLLILALAVVFAVVYRVLFRELPRERWQFVASCPWRKTATAPGAASTSPSTGCSPASPAAWAWPPSSCSPAPPGCRWPSPWGSPPGCWPSACRRPRSSPAWWKEPSRLHRRRRQFYRYPAGTAAAVGRGRHRPRHLANRPADHAPARRHGDRLCARRRRRPPGLHQLRLLLRQAGAPGATLGEALLRPAAPCVPGENQKIAFAGDMEAVRVVPIQAVTCVLHTALALLCTGLFFHGLFAAAFALALVGSQLWRVYSNFCAPTIAAAAAASPRTRAWPCWPPATAY